MKKVVTIIIFVMILILGVIPPTTHAANNIITLQQIADNMNIESILSSATILLEYDSEDKINVDIRVEENKIIVSAIPFDYIPSDNENAINKLETVFTLDGNTLSSPAITYPNSKRGKFDYGNASNLATTIAKLEQIDPEVVTCVWDTGILDKSSLQKEGIQYVNEMYQIDLSKKLNILDLRPLYKTMDKFQKDYGPKIVDISEVSKTIGVFWEDGNIEIRGRNEEFYDVETTTLTLDETILTSEPFKFSSGGDMTSKDTFAYFSSLYFMECIGQTIYGYEPNEIVNIFTRILKGESEKKYTLEEDGIEVINLGSSEEIQFAIDINKNDKSDNTTDTPTTEEPDNTVQNDTVENEIIENNILTNQEDNTIAKVKIPQTGLYINIALILAILAIIFAIAVVVYNKRKEKNNL